MTNEINATFTPADRLCVLCGPDGCALAPGESHADPPRLLDQAPVDCARVDWLDQYRRLQAVYMHATAAERERFASDLDE